MFIFKSQNNFKMKIIPFLLALMFFQSCQNNAKKEDKKPIEVDVLKDIHSVNFEDSPKIDCFNIRERAMSITYQSKLKVDKIDGKLIDFYLNHPNISMAAKALFKGEIKLSDNDCTFTILDSTNTENAETRPFYLHLLMFINTVSDGALSEVLGGYDLKFLNKYPNEFFDYILKMKANEAFNQVIFHIAFELYATDSIEGFLKFQSELRKKIASKHRQTADKFLSAIKKQFEDNLKGQ